MTNTDERRTYHWMPAALVSIDGGSGSEVNVMFAKYRNNKLQTDTECYAESDIIAGHVMSADNRS